MNVVDLMTTNADAWGFAIFFSGDVALIALDRFMGAPEFKI
jgi:hypothetical protein